MFHKTLYWLLLIAAVIALMLLVNEETQAGAPPQEPPGPDRFVLVSETYQEYIWWLTAWEDNEVECVLHTDHEGLPTGNEIFYQCGQNAYQGWVNTPLCHADEKKTCSGFYFYLAGVQKNTRQVTEALPPPRMWVTAPYCLARDLNLWCPDAPVLRLEGEDPLDEYRITRVEGWLDDQPFVCAGERCELAFPEAGDYTLRAWGYSSYGDSTPVMEARVRVLPDESGGWLMTVISPLAQGVPQAACAYLWDVFPSADTPAWLRMPASADALQTEVPYAGLAGQMLIHGLVSAPDCADKGLSAPGWADACGMAAAYPSVVAWQNQFDEAIFNAARQYQISPWLLKNIFAAESQFWPGALLPDHAGLGQMTTDGADLALMWRPLLFEQFCPTVFSDESCAKGYNGLNDADRAFLRLALMASVNAECPSCDGSVDMDKAHDSVYIFADVLRASCAQTGQIITNETRHAPGDVFSYEDLWRLTLANYHSGAGCLRDALAAAWQEESDDLSWDVVSAHFPPGCVDALPYVKSVIP